MIKWLFTLCVMLSAQLYATEIEFQENGYHFGSYNKSHGLLNNQISDVFQDSQGFLWIATYEGLIRFDGIDFINLDDKHNLGETISSIYSTSITEDNKAMP